MGWFLRKSVRFGPVRINFSKRGIGMSAGVQGLRVGTGPRGPYVAGGRGGIYFRQQLGSRRKSASAPAPRMLAAQPAPGAASAAGTRSDGGIPLTQPPLERVIEPPRYPAWALFALAGGFALGWLFTLIGSSTGSTAQVVISNIGVALILGVQVAVCVLDWTGFITLDGRIRWGWLRGWQRLGLGLAYLCIVIMPGVYLGFACRDWVMAQREANQRAPLEQQRRISELEAQLGMLPQTEGACRVCHKPLQVGAQFCTYCRAPVREQARICPACGAAALPDGQFCPKCGAAL